MKSSYLLPLLVSGFNAYNGSLSATTEVAMFTIKDVLDSCTLQIIAKRNVQDEAVRALLGGESA